MTCDMDRWHFRLQCLTLEKYLEPCDMHVIINEPDPNPWLVWFDSNIKPHVSRHRIIIHVGEDFFTKPLTDRVMGTYRGWVIQQVFKLVFSTMVDQPYLILDSKNWLIKPTSYDEITKKRKRALINDRFVEMRESVITLFDIPDDTKNRPALTPFYIESDITKSMFERFGGIEPFMEWFLSFEYPSEFTVYDLFAQSIGCDDDPGTEPLENCFNFWGMAPGITEMIDLEERVVCQNQVDLDLLKTVLSIPEIKMLTIHRGMVASQSIADEIESLILSLP